MEIRAHDDADHWIPAPAARQAPVGDRHGEPRIRPANALPPRVVMLGTGDPLNHERAQASLAFQLREGADGETLLIDTSSGTILLGQLRAAGIALMSIRHVCISHRHFDHAGGLAPLLVALSAIPEAAVTVHAPPATRAALHDLLAASIPGVERWLGPRLQWSTVTPGRAFAVGDATVTPFAVEHGLECVGFRVERGSRSIVYSADTRPCASLSAHAEGADLLIHEAYGVQATADEAHHLGHATAADAARMAHAAGVRHLLLTHLRSSRLARPQALGAEAAAIFSGRLALATDLTTIAVEPVRPIP